MASKHGFKWESLALGAKATWAIIVTTNCLYVFTVCVSWLRGGGRPHALWARGGDAAALATVLTITELCSLPARIIWHGCMLVCIFTVHCAGRLHRHDLLAYACIMSRALEVDEPGFDPAPQLKQLEFLVTTRLRHASSTWVRTTLETAACFFLVFILTALSLVSTKHSITAGSIHACLMCGSVVGLGAILWPLAEVAETFEYDVLRYLNNPLVLSRAQKYFGQQLLPHLHCLDWGFRFAGSIVNTRSVGSLLLAMLATLLGSCASVIIDRWDEFV